MLAKHVAPHIAHCIYFPFLHFKAQNSARPVDHSEIESLRKECEAAKEKTKKTLEKYFSESDRLKAIIDEQQGILHSQAWWRRGGLNVSAFDSRSSGRGSTPGRQHCVVFLGSTLYPPSASLHPGLGCSKAVYPVRRIIIGFSRIKLFFIAYVFL